ncbi:MAG: adenosylhomocysteinase, partial [Syntrophomonas sp.]|nr:adenosylhomocysteinase [Syntrophomonas sp.]
DLSFSLQALSLLHVIQNRPELGSHVYNVPAAIDQKVAWLKLAADGVEIDRLTAEQVDYLASWDTN